MASEQLNDRINGLIEHYLASGGTLGEIAQVVGMNLSTLWRHRTGGFKDPFAVYLIAKMAQKSNEEASALAKEVCVANGGNPDLLGADGAPIAVAANGHRRHRGSMREQVREMIREELALCLAKEPA